MQIRPFEPADAPAAAALLGRAFGTRWDSQAELTAYIEEIFLRNPWVDPELPSWAAVENERLVGFIGVMCRPMRFKGAPIRSALLTQLMIEPQPRYAVAAAKLVRRALQGPQDLTISDGANETARKLWEAAGGSTSALYTLQWRRLLRPAQYGVDLFLNKAGRRASALAGPLCSPFTFAADAYAARRTGLLDAAELNEEPLDAASLLAAQCVVPGKATLRPEYQEQSLEWLLGQAQAKRRYGPLQGRLLRQRNGTLAGWYLYYLNRETSKVVQMGARDGMQGAVLEHLFRSAWRGGTTVIEGRMEPSFAAALGQLKCFFLSPNMYTLFHARNADLTAALARGEAFFSRLDGEWWMRFHGEPPQEREPAPAFPFHLMRGFGVRQKPAKA
jgi:hypothetical protein